MAPLPRPVRGLLLLLLGGAEGARILKKQRDPARSAVRAAAAERSSVAPLAAASPTGEATRPSGRSPAASAEEAPAAWSMAREAGGDRTATLLEASGSPLQASAPPAAAAVKLVASTGDASPRSNQQPHHYDGADVVHGHKKVPAGVQVPVHYYFGAAILLAAAVVFIYGPRGPRVVVGVLVYLAALSTMTLSVKWVFSTHAYSFPKFVTTLHFLSGATVTGLILAFRKAAWPIPTAYEFWVLISPIAIAVVASIGANNMALVHCSAAFTEIIGSSTCLITIALVVFMGMPFDKWLILPSLLVAFGCALSITGEVNFSAIGMLLCFTANAFRSLKASLQQKLMTGETRDKFDPCALLFWICLPSMCVMFGASLATEGLEPYQRLATMEAPQLHGLAMAVAASCVNATILNLAQLFVTKDLGAVGSQLAAQAKSVLVVLGSMVLFSDPVTLLQVFGFMQVLLGVLIYSRMDSAPQGKEAPKTVS